MRWLFALVLFGSASAALAEPVTIPAGTEISLETMTALTSKKQVKGDQIPLKTSKDVWIDGHLLIPAGTSATGQISDSRVTGGFGMNGKLSVAPLFLVVNGQTIRLIGAAKSKNVAGVDTVIAVSLVTTLVSGHSGVIPVGTRINGATIRAATISPVEVKLAIPASTPSPP